MVLKPFNTEIINGLCSKDQLDLLDSVDRLRSQGIDHYVSLPQIIVCGDQSSGKSSVLEAISGVSFPIKGNLCTRFPTELILRKSKHVGVSVSIVPHQSRNEAERESLGNFRESLDGFGALPDLIEKAKTAMAIGPFGAFARDLLRIEISGPDRPHLTIVDLPGLIHSETKQQSTSDVELVQEVVKSYMKEPRSIILAVVSAKNDYANQIVLKLARAADKNGTRTLGVITKPDVLIPGSDSEAMYVSLARNLEVEFRLGWHVLKNMDSETGKWSLAKRDETEQQFFEDGIWATLPQSILGISLLRERLSKLLFTQIAAELPSLVNEIELKSSACRAQLQKLGQPRASLDEQRLYLLTLSSLSQSLTKAAVDGTYNDPFFGDAKTDAGYQKRIRAVVQNLNQSFAEVMSVGGHSYAIRGPVEGENRSTGRRLGVVFITREKYLDRIEELMKRTRGRELPGTFNPMIISDLFLEQSKSWEILARSHIEKVARAVKTFLKHLISHIADASTYNTLFQALIEPALHTIVEDLKAKTTELLAPHQRGHPITYNHYFTETVQNVRRERSRADFTRIIQNFFGVDSLEEPAQLGFPQSRDFRPLLEALMKRSEPDMNRYACSEALDCMQAYYKVALKRFIDDIAIEAIEFQLISKLSDILSPVGVTFLTADKVADIAGESDKSRELRSQLTGQLQVLEQGFETCKRFMVGRVQLGTNEMIIRTGGSNRSSLASSVVSVHLDSEESIVEEEPVVEEPEPVAFDEPPPPPDSEFERQCIEAPVPAEDIPTEDDWGHLPTTTTARGKKKKKGSTAY